MNTLEKDKKSTKGASLLKKATFRSRNCNPLFTYAVKRVSSSITLQQQETGFSITLEWENLEKTLRVTRFTIFQNQHLQTASQDLYEAATLEIVFQKMELLFSYAKYHNLNEILFLLLVDETIHKLDCFKDLFKGATPLIWGHEKRMAFTLSCVLQEFFFEQIESMKTKTYHELWQAQAYDFYLRKYLQSHPKGTPLLTKVPMNQENKAQESKTNLIMFPRHSQA